MTNQPKREGKRVSKKRGDNVIHVVFGPGGGRLEAPNPNSNSDRSRSRDPRSPRSIGMREPLSELFSAADVTKLFGLSREKLRTLDRKQIVSPSGMRNGKRAYTFQDLIALRATSDLLVRRVRLKDVETAIATLRQTLPNVERPLHELRIVSDGSRVVVRTGEGSFEPLTGQMHLDFTVGKLREEVVRFLRPGTLESRARAAYDLYAKASHLDEDPKTYDAAESYYRRAIEFDPKLAIAYTNLGNVRFRRGDDSGAVALYHEALTIDQKQPEAHYNLGYVLLERGDAAGAIPFFERAIESDPRFADAHFNLAMAYEDVGLRIQARPHWEHYLKLEPCGTWAGIARQYL